MRTLRFPFFVTSTYNMQQCSLIMLYMAPLVFFITGSPFDHLHLIPPTPPLTSGLSFYEFVCFEALQSCPTVRPHRRQPTRLPHPWVSPGKNTGVVCHFLLQCMKVKSESEVAQSCLTLGDPMDCSPPGSPAHGVFQARVLEWVPAPSPDLQHCASS